MDNHSIDHVIRNRRTIRTLSDQAISMDVIYELLKSASYAPYHSKDEPWEVIVVGQEQERQVFVKEIMNSYERLNIWAQYDPKNLEAVKKRTQEYFFDVPLTLIVTAPICESQKANLEAVGAVSAFIQNFQLAAWSKKIGVTWRTIPVIFDPIFKQNSGVAEERQVIGLLDLSVITEKMKLPTSRRKPVTQWMSNLSEKLSESRKQNEER